MKHTVLAIITLALMAVGLNALAEKVNNIDGIKTVKAKNSETASANRSGGPSTTK